MKRNDASHRIAAAIQQGAGVIFPLFDTIQWDSAVKQQFVNTLVGAALASQEGQQLLRDVQSEHFQAGQSGGGP